MDLRYQSDLAKHIKLLERYLRLLRETRRELLESLGEIDEATRIVQTHLEDSREALVRQSIDDD